MPPDPALMAKSPAAPPFLAGFEPTTFRLGERPKTWPKVYTVDYICHFILIKSRFLRSIWSCYVCLRRGKFNKTCGHFVSWANIWRMGRCKHPCISFGYHSLIYETAVTGNDVQYEVIRSLSSYSNLGYMSIVFDYILWSSKYHFVTKLMCSVLERIAFFTVPDKLLDAKLILPFPFAKLFIPWMVCNIFILYNPILNHISVSFIKEICHQRLSFSM